MKLISFDIGIKNMAYCIINIDLEKNTFDIIRWDILNLMNENLNDKKFCNVKLIKTGVLCGKSALYNKS